MRNERDKHLRDQILCDITKKLIDIKKLYGNNNLNVDFFIPGKTDDPGKIKFNIKENF